MKLTSLALRLRWLQFPTGLLVLLLQRAPLLRLMVSGEGQLLGNAPAILRSAFAVAAMGAYNSVAGATVFNVVATPTAATPTSGSANATFTINGTVGTAMDIGITESGAPAILKSWRVTGTLPTGLSVVGGNPVNVVAPYKMTISGTPSASGTFPVTVTGYDVVGGTGGNNARITVTFTITGGVSTAPSITTQPAAVTVTAGAPASFTVAASGNPTPTYQWQKGGVSISGATSATYSIASTVTGDAGNYTAVATNSSGSATSTAATLTVNPALAAPTITTSPTDVTVTTGAVATFTVVASGNPTPTYQWQKGGANIPGATSATYTIASVVTGDAGNYAAVVTNSRGSATSASATLTVSAALTAPSITTQPLSQTVTAGNSVTFTAAASGNPTPTYQWQKGGVNISGATSATYTIASTAAGDAGNYAVVATSTSGSVTSATATLTVSTQVDNAPTTLAGRSAVVVVTNGSGVLASSGGYRISFSAASAVYTISSLSNVASSAGTYTYTKTGTNAGSITINDVGIGAATTLSLSFSSGSTASYSIAVSGGTQSGTAVFEESSVAADNALTAIAGKSAIVVISEGTSPLASIGGYRIAFSATTTAYTITPLSSNLTSSSGTYVYTKTGANTGSIAINDAGVGVATSQSLIFTSGSTASYSITAGGGIQRGTAVFEVANVAPISPSPAIVKQPVNLAVTVGRGASFNVAASGNPTPTYQWQKGGVTISGATSATYTIASTVAGDAGNYAVVVTNSSGSVTSATAALTVSTQVDNAPTTLAGRSAVVVVTNGSGVLASSGGYRISFSAASAVYTISSLSSNVASSAGTYTYTKTGTNAGSITINDVGVGAATTLSLSFSSGSTASYSIAVSGGTQSGTAVFEESSVAADNAPTTLSGKSAIVVISEGTSPFASIGGSRLIFSATTAAYTSTPLSSNVEPGSGTYVYTKTGTNTGNIALTDSIVGVATTRSLIFTSASTASYSITAGGGSQRGTAVFEVAALAAPTFTTQPAGQSVTAGASVTFTAATGGNPTPTYQWRKDAVNISGATSATFTIASVVAGDAASYTVVATNSVSSVTSSAATLTVSAALAAPAVTTQPSSATVVVGEAASFTIVASGNPTPTYQWKKGGVIISGATGATYTIASTGPGDAGSYTVVATNGSGTVTSNAATLTVNPAPPVLPTTQLVITGKPVALGIVASTTGTIKWQVSTDSGSTYSDLADNATYRGTTTAVLEILLATNALNNNRYRYQVTLSGQTTASTATTLSVKPAYLLMPVGLKIDSANNLYVTDAAAQVIVKITSDFKIASLAGTAIAMGSTDGTGTVARFNEPSDLVINDDGSFLLTDTSNASLRKVTTAGVVTTFAGTSGSKGSADGTGAAARFSAPVGITRDAAGNVYVADQTNHVIRRVTPAGVVTTLAGTAGAAGSTDGAGAAARFNLPTGVAINSADVLYVADFGSHTLRKVTAAGVVSTFAGTAGTSGSVDGTGTAARFNKPSGLALDTAGNLYVADTGNSTVRKVSPAGVVTTLAGLSAIAGLKDGTGALAWFNEPEGVTSDTAGNLYVADTGNAVIRKITSAGVVTTLALTGTAPVITTQPASVSVTTGSSASLSVTASGDGVLTYQWKKDGTDVAGATTATYAVSATSSSSAGSYTVVVSNFLGSVTSSAATLTVNAAPAPAPAPAPSSGGGGGGAPSYGFLALLALWAWRRQQSTVA